MSRKGGYWAHSPNARGEPHDLRDHLESVAAMAERFAEPFEAGGWGYLAGLWHDLGKFSEAFQRHIRAAGSEGAHEAEVRGAVDHASAGAQHAVSRWTVLGHLVAYAIAGHHSGLLDAISDGACLERRLRKSVEPWQQGLNDLAKEKLPELPPFLKRALSQRQQDPKRAAFSCAFFARMVFSCLVDADFLDTEAFLSPETTKQRAVWPSDILTRMKSALDSYVGRLPAKGPVDVRRRDLREACLRRAGDSPGLFSLTAPTGAGKTLSSLTFAIEHALTHGLHRIVYVMPFTTIIEQNAAVFRMVFADLCSSGHPDPVVEHHSALELDQESAASRLASENWNAPLVVTTSVQFYESLFGNRASRCRKLHNLARSVIVLDEAQKLPVDYLAPCLLAMEELTSSYGATVVLCTATQPAVQQREDFSIGLQGVREIVPEPQRLYRDFKRVEVRDLGNVADTELVERLLKEEQVLCILNTRRHARDLYRMIVQDRKAIHLSAAMCPEHRTQVLETVRCRLERGEPCRVVSTQLVEAGVDLDFPVVYRSLAGVDSIAQAAGRCNRNGRRPIGTTYVFRSQHALSEAFLRETTEAALQLLGAGRTPPLYQDILSPEAVEHYFRLYYWNQQQRWDARGIVDRFKLGSHTDLPFLFDFRSAAESFHLIDDLGKPVIVPWGELGRSLCRHLRTGRGHPRIDLLRSLQRFIVEVPTRTWYAELNRSIELVDDRYAVLMAPETHYAEDVGLVLEAGPLSAETLIV